MVVLGGGGGVGGFEVVLRWFWKWFWEDGFVGVWGGGGGLVGV